MERTNSGESTRALKGNACAMTPPFRLSAHALDPLGFTQADRLQSHLVLRWFDLSTEELKCIVERTSDQRDTPVTHDQLVAQLAFLANAITICLRDAAKSAAWFRAPNPMLGDWVPLDMIALGRIDRLELWIEGALQSFNEYPK